MEKVRPRPTRPYDNKLSHDNLRTDSRQQHSKSVNDMTSLSRTSSFLSFTGLESLKSSALFGIFEKGGYEPEPPDPDLAAFEKHDFKLSSTAAPQDLQAIKANALMTAIKLLCINVVAMTFITLFNQIPSTNKYCSISPAQGTNPFLYSIAATLVAACFPTLKQIMTAFIHRQDSSAQSSTVEARSSSNTNQVSIKKKTKKNNNNTWSFNVLIRYFAGFLGLAYAGTKLDFSQPSQFNICVALVSLCANVLLVRSISGLVTSLALTGVATGLYILFVQVPHEDMIGATLLIWLNVLVYGSLGKMMRIYRLE